jgi:NO-binding membrane sensor protein with MHYT domain
MCNDHKRVTLYSVIASMHYTAMAATYFVPLGVSVEPSTPLFAQSLLIYMIACGIAVLPNGNLSLLALLSMQNRSA